MKENITEEQIEAILKALDEAIETGPWEESNFLKVIGKNLREIRAKFVAQTGLGSSESLTAESNLLTRVNLRVGQQEVFVALYSTEGNSLGAWERIVANLPRQIVSRPVYANEQDVEYLIKSKENKVNEAYVGIYINQSDILSVAEDKILKDKFGKHLLTLKDRAIVLENISRFVHLSGVYKFTRGRLVKS